MRWIERLRRQPLRTKLVLTTVGTAVVVFGAGSPLTFRYWREQSEAAAEQQALLAAASVRSAVEAGMSAGEPTRARSALRDLSELESITAARVYATTGTVLVSTNVAEEGSKRPGVWVPSPVELPERGTARRTAEGDAVNAFLPIKSGGAAVLEVDFSLAPLEAAMDRAAKLGLLLLIGSVAAVILIVATMLEREVMTPIERVVGMLSPEPGSRSAGLERIEESVVDLVRKEREATAKAAEQEERLATQAGFAEVGEMAAEMAHEFKRPLASIRSAVGLLEQEYDLNDQAQSLLGAVDAQLVKLAETMQDLFALAKPMELEADEFEVADAVDSALIQLAGLTDTSGRKVERRYDSATPPVSGDQHRLEQAVLNLLLNAMEAMEAGGVLTVLVRPEGGHAVVEVRDTGPGIPPEEREKVVRPFYSTKPGGTGLGLPLVARVVAAHSGTLEIESEVGRGTAVRITLPCRPLAEVEGAESWATHES